MATLESFGNNFVHGGSKRRGAKVVMVCLEVVVGCCCYCAVAFEKLFGKFSFDGRGRGLNHILFPMQRQCGLCIRELKKLLMCTPKNPNPKPTLHKTFQTSWVIQIWLFHITGWRKLCGLRGTLSSFKSRGALSFNLFLKLALFYRFLDTIYVHPLRAVYLPPFFAAHH